MPRAKNYTNGPAAHKPDAQTEAVPYNATPQPVQAPTGLPYGDHQAATDAQGQVPLAGAAGMPTPAPTPDGQLLDAAQNYDFQPVGLVAPTARPSEPVTAGLAVGPGPGPEPLTATPGSVSSIFDALARSNGDALFAQLAERARRQGR